MAIVACGGGSGSNNGSATTPSSPNARVVTNLLVYSNDLTRSNWIRQGGATSPAANTIMKKGSPGACTTQSVIVSGTSVMALVHAKAGSLASFSLTIYNVTRSMPLASGSFRLPSGYKPFQLQATANISSGDTIKLYIYPSDPSDSATGDISIENAALIDSAGLIEPTNTIEPIITAGAPATSSFAYTNNLINMACWGDSLTAASGGFPDQLHTNLAASTVYNGGVGGETSTQIKARFLTDSAKWGDLTVIWAGRNNYHDPATVKADIAAMVSRLTTDKYIILSVLNGNFGNEYVGQADYNTIIKLNQDLATLYPGHYVDVRAALIAAYNPAILQDVTDHGNDVPPSSLRSDNLHLNGAGYGQVMWSVYNFIISKGWDIPAQTAISK